MSVLQKRTVTGEPSDSRTRAVSAPDGAACTPAVVEEEPPSTGDSVEYPPVKRRRRQRRQGILPNSLDAKLVRSAAHQHVAEAAAHAEGRVLSAEEHDLCGLHEDLKSLGSGRLAWNRTAAQQRAESEEGRGADDDGPSGSGPSGPVTMHDPTATDTEESEEEDAAAEEAASGARGTASASTSASARRRAGRFGRFGSAVVEEEEAATGRVSQGS
mmetsp:Transcript_28621/g.77030  ORF Transcript_28621/g.77030 Transcript_28621/m.77030 type:complete len:215 (+) Transcript_28621:258-902(+)